jgi:hypothetical protein
MADNINYTGAPEIGPKIDPGGGFNINATPDSFGASAFSAIHKLGQTGFDAVVKQQELANDIEHNKMALDMSQKFSEEWEKMASKTGKAAHDYLPTFQGNLRQLYNDAVNGAPNPAIKEKLASTMFRDVDRWSNHGSTYAGTQLRQAHNEVHTQALEDNVNKVELMREQPIPDILEQVQHGTGGLGGLDSVRERLHSSGIDPYDKDGKEIPDNMATYRAEEAKYWGKAVGPTIETLSDNWENGPKGRADLKKAEELFKQTRDRMDAKTANLIEKRLQPKLDKAAVAEMADAKHPIPDEAGYYPTTAAGQRRAMLDSTPSRENAQRMGIAQPAAGGPYRGPALPASTNQAIDKASAATGVSADLLKTFANFESSGRHGEQTGRYKGVFQLSDEEFKLHGKGDIFNVEDNTMAAARKIKADTASFRLATGRDATPFDLYLIHQQGPAGAPAHVNNPSGVAWKNVLPFYTDAEAHRRGFESGEAMAKAAIWGNVPTDQRAKFPGGVDSLTSGQFMDMWRGKFERMTGGAQPAAGGAQPGQPQDNLLAPGGMTRSQLRENNLIEAKRAFPDNPVRQHLYNIELNRRAVVEKTNLSGERNFVDATMKDFDLRVSKGLPGLTLESTGLTEDRIRAAHKDKPWVAEHIIESFRLQSANADKLASMKFAPKEDWDAYLRDASNGLGIDTAIKAHREKSGSTSAFDVGANPEARGEILANDFAIKEKVAATARKAYSDHMEEIKKDPAGYLITYGNPAIMKAKKAVDEAGNDPAKRDSAFREYVSKLQSAQLQMGVPEDKVRVLTNAKAEQTVADIMKSDNPKRDLDVMKSTYGSQFQSIFRDLVQHGKLPSKFEALTELDNQNANLLAGRIKAEATEKGNEHRRQMETLLGDKRGKIAKTVRDNDTTKDWMLSMAYRQVGDPQRAEVHNTVNMLAEARVLELGEDVSTASDNAVKAFTKGLKFTKDHVAIPTDKYEGVMAEANDHVNFLDPNSIVVPAAMKHGGYDNNRYVSDLKMTRSWRGTPDGDGMYLVDHVGNPVITMKGDKADLVRVTFDRPRHSISNASPLGRAPDLFFEALGD